MVRGYWMRCGKRESHPRSHFLAIKPYMTAGQYHFSSKVTRSYRHPTFSPLIYLYEEIYIMESILFGAVLPNEYFSGSQHIYHDVMNVNYILHININSRAEIRTLIFRPFDLWGSLKGSAWPGQKWEWNGENSQGSHGEEAKTFWWIVCRTN